MCVHPAGWGEKFTSRDVPGQSSTASPVPKTSQEPRPSERCRTPPQTKPAQPPVHLPFYPSCVPSQNFSSHTPINSPHARTIDEIAAHCFGCGANNPQGLHLTFTLDTSDAHHPIATAHVQLTELHQGPPRHIHGGIVATLLDEAMSKLNRPLGLLAMTRHMEVDYLRPSPLHTPLTLISRHDRRDGRKLFHTAELQLTATAETLARAKALFIIIDPRHLTARETPPPAL